MADPGSFDFNDHTDIAAAGAKIHVDPLVSKPLLLHGDCLQLMFDLPDNSVDMVCCDMPYGTTACKWDTVLPLDMLWHHYDRIVKDNGAIVLSCAQPFTTTLLESNKRNFRHHWIWDKVRGTGFQVAKKRPMMRTEDIVVFSRKPPTYNPIMVEREKIKVSKCYTSSDSNPLMHNDGKQRKYTHKYPTNILQFSNASQKGKVHPTQKPVELIEYLIKTYTVAGDTVLDNCMGSGTTGVACKNLNRKFIGIELDEKYYQIATRRIEAC